jgi:large subunit ribosomal protein L31e
VISLSEEEELSRVYTINLSKVWLAPRIRRAKRAINMIREFAQRHMKSEEIKIDQSLNEKLWERSIRHPPRRIRVKMVKDVDDVVTVSLYTEEVKEEEKKEEEKPKVEVAAPAATPTMEAVAETVAEEKKVEAPKAEPEEIIEEVKEEIKEEKPKREKEPEPEKIEVSEEELMEMLAESEGLEVKEEKPKRKGKKAKKEESEE